MQTIPTFPLVQCIAPGCDKLFEQTKYNKIYCGIRCSNRAERQRRKEQLRKETATAKLQTIANDKGWINSPTVEQLNAHAEVLLVDKIPWKGVTFYGTIPQGWTAPEGLAWGEGTDGEWNLVYFGEQQ